MPCIDQTTQTQYPKTHVKRCTNIHKTTKLSEYALQQRATNV